MRARWEKMPFFLPALWLPAVPDNKTSETRHVAFCPPSHLFMQKRFFVFFFVYHYSMSTYIRIISCIGSCYQGLLLQGAKNTLNSNGTGSGCHPPPPTPHRPLLVTKVDKRANYNATMNMTLHLMM
jgi:hypothetical protein